MIFFRLEEEELAVSFHDQVLLAHRCNARVDFGIGELLGRQKVLVDNFFRMSKLNRLKNLFISRKKVLIPDLVLNKTLRSSAPGIALVEHQKLA